MRGSRVRCGARRTCPSSLRLRCARTNSTCMSGCCAATHLTTATTGTNSRSCPAAGNSAAARKTAAVCHGTAAAAIASAALFGEAVIPPAVSITPAGPWAHAQEDAAVKVSWPVESIGRAGVGRVVVVAVRTNRWNADADGNLRLSRWRHGQTHKQCCRAD